MSRSTKFSVKKAISEDLVAAIAQLLVFQDLTFARTDMMTGREILDRSIVDVAIAALQHARDTLHLGGNPAGVVSNVELALQVPFTTFASDPASGAIHTARVRLARVMSRLEDAGLVPVFAVKGGHQ